MPTHFVFITDNHHTGEDRSRGILEALVPQVNALKPDFIVHGGDLVAAGKGSKIPEGGYENAIREAADLLTGFRAPLHIIPGNHDCDPADGSFTEFGASVAIPDVLDVVEVGPGLRLALVNVYTEDPLENVEGVWSDSHDRALRGAAADASANQCALLIIQHTWVLEPRRLPNQKPIGAIKNNLRLRKTIDDCPAVVAVFTGHRHRNRIFVVRDYLVCDTGCLTVPPMGFREVWLRDDGYFSTKWHTLDCPEIVDPSFELRTDEQNRRFVGEEWDQNAEILLPRLRDIWT